MSPRSGAASQIRDRFLEDDRRIEDLLERLIHSLEKGPPPRVSAVWANFEAELLCRSDTEERHLIPDLFEKNPRAARAILEEHKHLRARLAELRAAVGQRQGVLFAARTFADELRAHCAHESRVLYSRADGYINRPAGS